MEGAQLTVSNSLHYTHSRIMAQCMTGAKMFYCLWTTLASDSDPFVCAPIRPLPDDLPLDVAKNFIRTKILSRPYNELVIKIEKFSFKN